MSEPNALPAYPASVRDAAYITGIPVRTIQRWITAGWLKEYRDGRRYLVDLQATIDLAETRPNGRLPNPHAVA